jgi:hypothetical protein
LATAKQNIAASPSPEIVSDEPIALVPEMTVKLSADKKSLEISVPLRKPKLSGSEKTMSVAYSKMRTKITVGGQPVYVIVNGFCYPKK